MNRTIVILTSTLLGFGGLALAQGKPTDKPGAAPAAAGAKPAAAHAAAPAAPGAKPAPAHAAAPAAAPHAARPHAAAPAAPGTKPAPAHAAAPAAAPAKPAEPGKPAAGPAAAATAPAPAMPPPPKPPAELDEGFKYFNGTWKCDMKMPAGAMGPGSPEATGKAMVKFKKILGGWFYQGEYAMKKTKTTPAFKRTFLIAYETSTGYAGDAITFVGEGFMMGQKIKLRETMTRGPDKGAGHKIEVDMGKGFQLMGEDTCKR